MIAESLNKLHISVSYENSVSMSMHGQDHLHYTQQLLHRLIADREED